MFRIKWASVWAGATFGGLLLFVVGWGSDLIIPGVALWLKGPTLHGQAASTAVFAGQGHQLASGHLQGSGETVRVVSYNIRHALGEDGKINLGRIAAVLEQLDADVIALQEVDRYRVRSGMQDQIAWLGEKLGMSWHYAPTLQNGWSQYGNALLSRLPIVDYGVAELGGMREPRNLMRMQVLGPAGPVTVFNTHLGVLQEERRAQVERVLELVGHLGGPAVLMGDFNMSDDHLFMQELLVEWQPIPLAGGTMSDGSKADHVLVRPLAAVMQGQVHHSQASDHGALAATIDWRGIQSVIQ